MSVIEIFFIVVICVIILGLILRITIPILKDFLQIAPSLFVLFASIIIGKFIGGKIGVGIIVLGVFMAFYIWDMWIETNIYKKIKNIFDETA